jgi:hypothetical protein
MMDKTQAINVRRQLRALGRALDKATSTFFELDKEERKILYKPTQDFAIHLHFEMLILFMRSIQNCARPPRSPP